MNLLTMFSIPLMGLVLSAGCAERVLAVGLVLVYSAKQPTEVVLLNFDEHRIMDGRILPMYVSSGGRKQLALSTPLGLSSVPEQISATWRYEAIDPEDEASANIHPDWVSWREANATVPLRSEMTADQLKRLRTEPQRHRFKLVLIFDRDRLNLRWEVQERK